jgi:hypothetical protein
LSEIRPRALPKEKNIDIVAVQEIRHDESTLVLFLEEVDLGFEKVLLDTCRSTGAAGLLDCVVLFVVLVNKAVTSVSVYVFGRSLLYTLVNHALNLFQLWGAIAFSVFGTQPLLKERYTINEWLLLLVSCSSQLLNTLISYTSLVKTHGVSGLFMKGVNDTISLF